jgi:sterol desaturase/sphingolipid hydroxylase (fatty acid hydroxylase superfamily)
MHGIHHSQYQNETDSNYSTVFSWWDVIHKTIRLNVPQNKIVVGVPGYSNQEDNKLVNLIIHPFKKQKNYWRVNEQVYLKRENEQLKKKLHLME